MSKRVSTFSRLILSVLALAMLPPVGLAQGRSGALLEEIIVTARKREESLQDAPIAVSAFTGEQLEFRGLSDIDSLDQFTPNLVLNRSPTYSNVTNAAVYIRGIGQNDFTPVIDPGVGIYVDGVYLGRSVGAVLDIIDIDRIEILRGPQGTLFGRNTIGGAISLHSKKPAAKFGGKMDIKYGTDDRTNLRGTVNIPITENLFARFNAASFRQDGYVTRIHDGVRLGDDDTLAARLALRWLPADNLEVNFSGDYSRDREHGGASITTGIQPLSLGLLNPGGAPSQVTMANTLAAQLATNPAAMGTGGGRFFDTSQLPNGFPFKFLACFEEANRDNPACFNRRYIADGPAEVNFGVDPHQADLDVWGAALTIDWTINPDLKAKSISAWRSFEGQFSNDGDGSPVRVAWYIDIYQQEQVSQELQLSGRSFAERLDWILGIYYFHEKGKNINPVRFAAVDIQSGGYFDNQSWAVFAQGSWHVSEKLDLTLGLRYTEDSKDYLPDQYFQRLPVGLLPPRGANERLGGVNCPSLATGVAGPGKPCGLGDRVLPFETVNRKTSELVPMVNLSYRWNESLMSYFTYAEGFKSGGYTQRIFPPEPSLPDFDPEFVTSYEIGGKFDGWDERLRFNLALFVTDYSDLQLLVTDPSRLGPFVSNAGDAEVVGLEMEVLLTPAPGWFLSGSAGMQDLKRTALADNVDGLSLDSPFQQVSKWSANIQLYKEIALGEWGYVTPRFEWAYRSEWGTNANNIPREPLAGRNVASPQAPPNIANRNLSFGIPNPRLVEGDLHLFNASVRWDVKNTGLSISAGVDNLTDERYVIFSNYQDGFAFTRQTFHRGREWYLQGSYEFGGD